MSLPGRYCYWISPAFLAFLDLLYLIYLIFQGLFQNLPSRESFQAVKLMFADTVAELHAWPWVMNHSKNAVTLKILYKGLERWLRKRLLFWKNWVRFPAPTSGDSLITPAPDLQGHLQSHGIQIYRDRNKHPSFKILLVHIICIWNINDARVRFESHPQQLHKIAEFMHILQTHHEGRR